MLGCFNLNKSKTTKLLIRWLVQKSNHFNDVSMFWPLQEWLNSLTDFSWNVDVQRATHIRAVVSGDAGGALAPPEFESSVNPIPIQLAEYAHHITASTPGFENLTTSLHIAILPDWTFEKWGLSNFEFQSF